MMNSSNVLNGKLYLPQGVYTLISVDVDTTSRRFVDEIVQIACYSKEKQFSQYVMPFGNLNRGAQQRHQLCIINIGRFRAMRSFNSEKMIKAKSEIKTLTMWLEWLEDIKKNALNSMGIILIYHEQRKFVPYAIIEALNRYNMVERLLKIVRGFANGFTLAEQKCAGSVKSFTLRQLSKVLLNADLDRKNKDCFEGDAKVRSKLIYDVVHHLAVSEKQDLEEEENSDMKYMTRLICEHSTLVETDIQEWSVQKDTTIKNQNSFRPVFLKYFQSDPYNRSKAVKYRTLLAEKGYDLEKLRSIWTEKKKQGLNDVLKKMDSLKENEVKELTELFESFFDPHKELLRPPIKPKKQKVQAGNFQTYQNPNIATNMITTAIPVLVTTNLVPNRAITSDVNYNNQVIDGILVSGFSRIPPPL